jgi:hypothetical protein
MSSSDWFTRAFGAALADIRQKVVEEPTYGRAVTPRATSITLNSPGEKSPGEGLGWGHAPEPERGIDR